jgi:hypothetical protein
MLADVEHPAHTGVGYLAREQDLPAKTTDRGGTVADLRENRLEGNAAAEFFVLGLVDCPHPTFGKETYDAIASTNQLTDFEESGGLPS